MKKNDKTSPKSASLPILDWAKKLQAIAQTGLAYSKDQFDTERYGRVREIAVEMISRCSKGACSAELIESISCEVGYATPKVDVRAAVFFQEGLLLVRERSEGVWTLPGGWADIGDSPSMAVVREVKEESGYDIAVQKLAAVYDRDNQRHGHPPIPYHCYKLFFLCEIVGGSPQTSNETDAVSFFAEHCIPPLSLSRVTPQEIDHLFEHHRHLDWSTSFD